MRIDSPAFLRAERRWDNMVPEVSEAEIREDAVEQIADDMLIDAGEIICAITEDLYTGAAVDKFADAFVSFQKSDRTPADHKLLADAVAQMVFTAVWRRAEGEYDRREQYAGEPL